MNSVSSKGILIIFVISSAVYAAHLYLHCERHGASKSPHLLGLLFAAEKVAESNLPAGNRKAYWHDMGHIGQLQNQVKFYTKYALKVVCEIGFNAGHSALAFLNGPSTKYIGFDMGALPYSNVSAEFLQRSYPTRFQIIWGDSHTTVVKYMNGERKCDVFSVDGDHTAEGSLLDFYNAIKSTQPGGIILADDVSESFGVPKSWKKMIDDGLLSEIECEDGGFVGPYHKRWCAGLVLV
jgi:hypothetical protein